MRDCLICDEPVTATTRVDLRSAIDREVIAVAHRQCYERQTLAELLALNDRLHALGLEALQPPAQVLPFRRREP